MADETDLPLVPLDDTAVLSAGDDVADAAGSALDASLAPVVALASPAPRIGTGWLFDWDAGRFVLSGGRPAEVRGPQQLIQRVQLAVHTARLRFAAVPNTFGFDRVDDIIGTVANEEALSDYERRLTECVQSVPGCADVENFTAHVDTQEGVYVIDRFDIITDTGQRLPVGPTTGLGG
jgi:hypothetical protein